MIKTLSHWGILVECETIGAHSPLYFGKQRAAAGVVLTASGEILVHKDGTATDVAIVLDRKTGGLTEAQTAQVMQARRIGLALADGVESALTLKPVAHNWRFLRGDYMTVDEWLSQSTGAVKEKGKGGQNGHFDIIHL